MSSLRLVADERAGPTALGILLPPGMRTVLIVRPRALGWDLLLVQGMSGTTFRQMGQEEAKGVARTFFDALQEWGRGAPGHVGVVPSASGHLVWVDVGDFCLVACERQPGQPYRLLSFADEDEARQAAARTAVVLHPPQNVDQEVYFNTRHFT